MARLPDALPSSVMRANHAQNAAVEEVAGAYAGGPSGPRIAGTDTAVFPFSDENIKDERRSPSGLRADLARIAC